MHTLAITDATVGNLWAWGWGCCGQLGLGDTEDRHLPTRVSGGWAGARTILAAAGQMHSFAVLEDGSLWAWGGGGDGKLGLGDTKSRRTPQRVDGLREHDVLQVSAGDSHSAAVTAQLELFLWGDNSFGQLGLADCTGRVEPTSTRMAGVLQVSCGENQTGAVDISGVLWTWGGGGAGQLGHNDRKRRLKPTAVAPKWLGGARSGRCRRLPAERALAFAMLTHSRLGAPSPFAELPSDLVCRIAKSAHPWPRGRVQMEPSILRLLGGGFAESRPPLHSTVRTVQCHLGI